MTDRWGRQPAGFNRPAAEAVYKALTSLDEDSAQVLGRLFVAETVDRTLIAHGTELAKRADAVARKQATTLRKNLGREVLAKSRRGEDTSDEMRALAAIAKAFGDDAFDRDKSGRFAAQEGRSMRAHARIGYSGRKPIKAAHASQLGVPFNDKTRGYDRETLGRYQEAYGQLADLTGKFAGMPEALAHLNVSGRNGSTTKLARVGDSGKVDLSSVLDDGEYLESASVSVVPPHTAAGAAYDAFDAVGMPGLGAAAYRQMDRGVLNQEKLRGFGNSLYSGNDPQDDFVPSRRAFRTLESGSKLLSDSLGPNAPRGAQYALAVGQHVGRYGPEAQRVIGPVADKAAYRYRGTQRSVSSGLGSALDSIAADPSLRVVSAGGMPNVRATAQKRRDHLLHGHEGPDGSFVPSKVIDHMRRQLPRVDLNTLQLKSGVVPPSKGFIIDSKGRVNAEQIGYGDDHYLPFNLRNLSSLKHGEYVRTRTYGGPTTEDIYAGLVGGARGLTVVSHNGVYTVDFSDELRGGRRFNDKAGRMVARYGQLLDAVNSGEVTQNDLSPSRMAEIRAAAARVGDPDRSPERFKAEMDRLVAKERKAPTLSKEERQKAATDFFASEMMNPGSGRAEVRYKQVAQYVDETAQRQYERNLQHARMSGVTPPSLETVKQQVADGLKGGDPLETSYKMAEALGVTNELDRSIANAERENADRLRPLRLNGKGYATALEALQEQFPQYIDEVQFHEWAKDGAPGSKRDTGYVKPRHNRPGAALSGYFDRSISRSGKGKAHADTTRFQNRRPTDRIRYVDQEDRGPSRNAKTQESAAPDAPAGKVATQAKAEADKSMLRTLAGLASTGAAGQGAQKIGGVGIAGTPISTLVNGQGRPQLEAAAPELFSLFGQTGEQLADAYEKDPVKMGARAAKAYEQARTVLDLKIPENVATVFRGDSAKPARKPDEDAYQDLDRGGEFDFGRAAYERSYRPSVGEVTEEFADNDQIAEAIGDDLIPSDITDPTFGDRVKTAKARLLDERAALFLAAPAGSDEGTVDDQDAAELNAKAEGVLRAGQLHARYVEAQGRAPKEVATAGDDDVRVENHMHVYGEIPEALRNIGFGAST